MAEKCITCIVCPLGCDINIDGENGEVRSMGGQGCKRGETYAADEFFHPLRILTSTIKVGGSSETHGSMAPLVAVRTEKPVPKELLFKCMEEIRKVKAAVPVKRGDIIIPDILGTGVNLVATSEAE